MGSEMCIRDRTIASAINEKGGLDAVNLRVAEQYVTQFGKLAQESNTLILPSDAADIASFVGTVTTAMSHLKGKGKTVDPPTS